MEGHQRSRRVNVLHPRSFEFLVLAGRPQWPPLVFGAYDQNQGPSLGKRIIVPMEEHLGLAQDDATQRVSSENPLGVPLRRLVGKSRGFALRMTTQARTLVPHNFYIGGLMPRSLFQS